MFFLQSLNSKEFMPKRHMVASGCFFEPEEEVVPNPIVGRKKGSVDIFWPNAVEKNAGIVWHWF